MATQITTSVDGKDSIVTFKDGYSDISSDGFGPVMIGFPTTKITFVQTRFNGDGSNQKNDEVVVSVQVPTVTIMMFIESFSKTIRENKEGITGALKKMEDAIISF